MIPSGQLKYTQKYIEKNKIGQGNFGSATIVCLRSNPKKLFAAKKINLSSQSTKDVHNSHQEAKLLNNLRHPHIVDYIENFVEENIQIIIMEYCEEGDLGSHVKKMRQKNEFFSEDLILNWFLQICFAQVFIHKKKIQHRDIKTSNIFQSSNGIIKIGDFGISKVLEGTLENAETIVGTPYYMSPEVCESLPYSYKSDIWALGCVLYELCTLKHAFKAKNLLGLVYKIVQEKQEPIPSCYNQDQNSLCSKLLTKDYKMRPEINEVIQMPFFKRVAENFKSRRGKMDVHVPITIKKETVQNRDMKKQVKPNTADNSNSRYSENSLSNLTPMERIKKRKQIQADKRAKELIDYQKSMVKQDNKSQISIENSTPDKRSELDNTVESFNANDNTQETINLKTNTYNKMRISPHKKHSQPNSLASSFLPNQGVKPGSTIGQSDFNEQYYKSNYNDDTMRNRFNDQTLQSNYNDDTMKNRFNEQTLQSDYNDDTMKNRFNEQTLQSNYCDDTMKNRFNEQTLQSNHCDDTMKNRFNEQTLQSNYENNMQNSFNDKTIQSINIDSSDISVQQGLTSPYILRQDEITGYENNKPQLINQGSNYNMQFEETCLSEMVPTRNLEPRHLKMQTSRGNSRRGFPIRNLPSSNSADKKFLNYQRSQLGNYDTFRLGSTPRNSSRNSSRIMPNNEFLDETIQSIECNTNELRPQIKKPHSHNGPYRNYSLDNSRHENRNYSLDNSRHEKYRDSNQTPYNRNFEIREPVNNDLFKKKSINNKDNYLKLFNIKKSNQNNYPNYTKQDDSTPTSNRRGFMDMYDKSTAQNSEYSKETTKFNDMANEREMNRVMDVYDAYQRKDQRYDVNTRFPTIRDKNPDVQNNSKEDIQSSTKKILNDFNNKHSVMNNIKEKTKNMHVNLINDMGKEKFDNIYSYVRNCREKQIPETKFVNNLKMKYGNNVVKYLFDIDQLIFFEDKATK